MATTVRDPQRLLPRWLQVITIVFLMLWLLPVLYMLIISVSPDLEAAAGKMWPSTFVFTNYIDVWSTVPLARGLTNSFIASVSAGLIATVFGLGAAYCLTRFRFRGRGPFLTSLVGLQSVPGVMIILPLFVMFSSIGSVLCHPDHRHPTGPDRHLPHLRDPFRDLAAGDLPPADPHLLRGSGNDRRVHPLRGAAQDHFPTCGARHDHHIGFLTLGRLE